MFESLGTNLLQPLSWSSRYRSIGNYIYFDVQGREQSDSGHKKGRKSKIKTRNVNKKSIARKSRRRPQKTYAACFGLPLPAVHAFAALAPFSLCSLVRARASFWSRFECDHTMPCSAKDNFCYVCGFVVFVKKGIRKSRFSSPWIKVAYVAFFDTKFDPSSPWAPDSICNTCYQSLYKWHNGIKQVRLFCDPQEAVENDSGSRTTRASLNQRVAD